MNQESDQSHEHHQSECEQQEYESLFKADDEAYLRWRKQVIEADLKLIEEKNGR